MHVGNYLQNLDTTIASDYSLSKATKKLKRPLLHAYQFDAQIGTGHGVTLIKQKLLQRTYLKFLHQTLTKAYQDESKILETLKKPCVTETEVKKFTKNEVLSNILILKKHLDTT